MASEIHQNHCRFNLGYKCSCVKGKIIAAEVLDAPQPSSVKPASYDSNPITQPWEIPSDDLSPKAGTPSQPPSAKPALLSAKSAQTAAEFYFIDKDNNDTVCGEIDGPEQQRVLFAWMETYATYRTDALTAERELAYTALREIGESATVTWQDKLVGLVDGALKNDSALVEYWATAKQWRSKAIAAERTITHLRGELNDTRRELLGQVEAWERRVTHLRDELAANERHLTIPNCKVCHGTGKFIDSESGGFEAHCHCWQNLVNHLRDEVIKTLVELLDEAQGLLVIEGYTTECHPIMPQIDTALATARAEMPPPISRPKIVCLCGSTRFKDAFDEANYLETMAGNIVLSVGFMMHAANNKHGESIGATPGQKIALDELHKRKIDLADEVLVLNVGGYIGDSTRSEIEHATKTGKPVRYLERARAELEKK